MTKQDAMKTAQIAADDMYEAYAVYKNANNQWTYAKLSFVTNQDKTWKFTELCKIYPKMASKGLIVE